MSEEQPERPVEEGEVVRSPQESVTEPAKVMRIGAMIRTLLEEVRRASLDEPGRERLRTIYDESIEELASALSDDLADELKRLTHPFDSDGVPTEAELRVAQAQLVGWLEGLFHGIQAAVFAQQAVAHQQLEQMRQPALGAGGMPGQPVDDAETTTGGPGVYL
jgi:hypothetical protein